MNTFIFIASLGLLNDMCIFLLMNLTNDLFNQIK